MVAMVSRPYTEQERTLAGRDEAHERLRQRVVEQQRAHEHAREQRVCERAEKTGTTNQR
jgi:hypothetical protein